MPVGSLKNRLYGAALPIWGKRCPRSQIACHRPDGSEDGRQDTSTLQAILRRRHVVGTCIQTLSKGRPAECYTAGFARLTPPPRSITPGTFFRTASVAKLVTALLVFRLQTLAKLSVEEEAAAFLGYPVRNPLHPKTPVTLGMLMSHTSSLVDTAAYFASFRSSIPLAALLAAPGAFAPCRPGERFQYSNFAAGMVGCLLEARFCMSLEALAQQFLFGPLGLPATFDLSTLRDGGRFAGASLADGYKVLPFSRKPAFDARRRLQSAQPLQGPDPANHYLLASGNLCITAPAMAGLLQAALTAQSTEKAGTKPFPEPFIDARSLHQLREPQGEWPDHDIPLTHGMGMLTLDDPRVSNRVIYGHQGFAYGAVNGVFLTEDGDGFTSFTSGASEQRRGHLSLLNQDLIRLLIPS